jgi:hypothetical protein
LHQTLPLLLLLLLSSRPFWIAPAATYLHQTLPLLLLLLSLLHF